MTLKAGKQQQKLTGQGQGQGQGQSSSFLTLGKRKWVDICFDWNAGKCLKAQGACQSMKGTPLRHVCNWIPDKSKPNIYSRRKKIWPFCIFFVNSDTGMNQKTFISS
jgi:hypothetical protein